jgi:hypothetical protein
MFLVKLFFDNGLVAPVQGRSGAVLPAAGPFSVHPNPAIVDGRGRDFPAGADVADVPVRGVATRHPGSGSRVPGPGVVAAGGSVARRAG